jgi:hypothetical protein
MPNEIKFVGTNELTPKQFLERATTLRTLRMREKLLTCLLYLYVFLIITTITIFFLQGFHVCGFDLESSLLMWLGGATVGEVAGLITLTVTNYLKVN